MIRRAAVITAVITAVVATVGLSLSAQQAAPPASSPAIPRTADGKPDLTGIWDYATITPLERSNAFKDLVMTDAQARMLEKAVSDRVDKLGQASDPNRTAPPQGGDGSTGAAGNVGGYNNFWIDSGDRVAVIDGQFRSSLIIDPPDGRVPATTAEYRAGASKRAAARQGTGVYDHPEYRPLAERCLLSFGPTTPLIPNYFYNNNLQIVQTPDHVMIMMEMVHDARIVRMNAEHLPRHIRPWMGDSIGRWEGDSLVVDTTNFPLLQPFRGAAENLHIIERFKRVDANTILYRFTVDDPTVFTRQWSGEIPFRASNEQIYEYACHEGNYALGNILRGERQMEKEKEEAARKQQKQ